MAAVSLCSLRRPKRTKSPTPRQWMLLIMCDKQDTKVIGQNSLGWPYAWCWLRLQFLLQLSGHLLIWIWPFLWRCSHYHDNHLWSSGQACRVKEELWSAFQQHLIYARGHIPVRRWRGNMVCFIRVNPKLFYNTLCAVKDKYVILIVRY